MLRQSWLTRNYIQISLTRRAQQRSVKKVWTQRRHFECTQLGLELFYYKAKFFTATSPQLERSLKCIPQAEITFQQQSVKGSRGEGVNNEFKWNFRKFKEGIKLIRRKRSGTPPGSWTPPKGHPRVVGNCLLYVYQFLTSNSSSKTISNLQNVQFP